MSEQLTPPTILLIDDDPDFRKIMIAALRDRDYDIEEASSGKEAEEMLKDCQPSLMIVDGQLPDVDGIEWIAQQRAKGNRARIMFVSAFWRDPEVYHRLTNELGVSTLLHKPVFPPALGAQIDAELEQAEAEREPDLPVLNEGLAKMLAELRDGYAVKLPGLLRTLQDSISRARLGKGDPNALKDALGEAHKLRGTSGSYGFQQFAETMTQTEQVLRQLQKEPGNDALWKQLDLCLADAVATASNPSVAPLAVPAPSSDLDVSSKARILVLDDDPEFLNLAGDFGRDNMIEILACNTIDEAEKMASSGPVDAAIIDFHLGPADVSLKAVSALRKLPGKETIPVAFISGRGELQDRVAAAHAGASLFLEKPLDAAGLVAGVRQLVSIGQKTKPKVLMLDDDLDFASSLAAILRYENMAVEILTDGITILEQLQRCAPDLLILDANMPGLSGFDICRMLRTSSAWHDLPILFLTAQTGTEARVATFQAGADDYLSKPVVLEELLARVKGRLERARLRRERVNIDTLTGLLLRRAFLEELGKQLSACEAAGNPLTLALVEIEGCENANDEQDYLEEERLMAHVGRLFCRRFRSEDLRGRWSDRQLILAFSQVDKQTATAALSRLQLELKSPEFTQECKPNSAVSLTSGVAEFPADGASANALIHAAYQRLSRQMKPVC